MDMKHVFIAGTWTGFSSGLAITESRESGLYDTFAVEGFPGFWIIIISVTLWHLGMYCSQIVALLAENWNLLCVKKYVYIYYLNI